MKTKKDVLPAVGLENVKWIQGDPECGSPVFRRQFSVPSKGRAIIAVCGLGYFELYLNGKSASPDLLNPAWSNYEARPNRRLLYPITDEMACRVYYREYDVTDLLTEGENVLGVRLGNGWYNQRERNVEGDLWYGTPKLTFRLCVNGQTVAESDESTLWRPGFIVYNNLYFGEVQDFSVKEGDWMTPNAGFVPDENWNAASLALPPDGELMLQTCPADRVVRTLIPKRIGRKANAEIYDAGEVISGRVVLRSRNVGQQTVTLRFAEVTDSEGNLLYYSTAGSDGQMQKDVFRCTGEHILRPHFVWHGFRYFEVEGDAEVLCCECIAADIRVTSTFHSDNQTLNWLYDAFLRTLEGCLHGGVSTDSSNRERLGYTGDGQLTAAAALLLTDSDAFYRKWMWDIFDCQDRKTGHVQHTAPFYGGGGGPGCWGGAVAAVPWAVYCKTGDKTVLQSAVGPISAYLDYLVSRSEDGLVVREEAGGWCLGDWCCFGGEKLPAEFVNTYYFLRFTDLLAEIRRELDADFDMTRLQEQAARSRESMTRHFFDAATGDFVGNVQGSNALALDVGLGDERTLRNLEEKYRAGHLDTGIVGTDVLLRVLFERGCAQTAYHLLTVKGFPSFDYWRECGATTLWENWAGKDCSHAHQMFGGVTRYLFLYLLGMRRTKAGNYVVSPCLVDGLDSVSGSITLADGKTLAVSIEKSNGTTRVRVKHDKGLKVSVLLEGKSYTLFSPDQTICL